MILVKPAGNTISEYSDLSSDFSVLSLNRRVSELLSTAFPQPVWVRGEIAETSGSRGHTYFRLIEPSPDGMGRPLAMIDCTLFAGNRPLIVREFARTGQVFQLTEGMSIRVLGRVALWDKAGRYQLIVNRIDPSWNMGNQAMLLRKLVDKLKDEGILEANAELEMPLVPLNIGLITASESAAEQDFLQTLKESKYPFRVYTSHAPMQGVETARGVLNSFNRLLSIRNLDLVVLTRGGGSSTDLAWFNDEDIAGVISQVPWPVISAIGHETDTTLPDYVAHTALKTPTQAAAFLVNRITDFLSDIDSLAVVLDRSVSAAIATANRTLSSTAAVLLKSGKSIFTSQKKEISVLRNLLVVYIRNAISTASGTLEVRVNSLANVLETGKIRILRRELFTFERELISSAFRRIKLNFMHLEYLDGTVTANDPSTLYRKGWATVRTDKGKLLRSIRDTTINTGIEITLKDGSLLAETKRIIPGRNDDE